MVRGLGGHSGQAALTGLLGRLGSFYLAGPRESPTQAARGGLAGPAPGSLGLSRRPAPAAPHPSSPDAGLSGWVPVWQTLSAVLLGNPGVVKLQGVREGGAAVFCRGNCREAAGGTVGGSVKEPWLSASGLHLPGVRCGLVSV